MKPIKLSLISLFSAIAISACAQSYEYVPMPTDSGASWRVRFIYGLSAYESRCIDYLLYTNGEDTTLGPYVYTDTTIPAYVYKKLFCRVHDSSFSPSIPLTQETFIANYPDCFWGGYREDSNKKIHFSDLSFFCESISDWHDYQLYDFNAMPGDSCDYGIGTKITFIDSVLVGGVLRKRYHTIDETSTYPDYIIEGIGSIRGLFPLMEPYESASTLLCFSQHGEVLYSTSDSCGYIYPSETTNVSPMAFNNQIAIYPSPFVTAFAINNNTASYLMLSIYNYIGEEIVQSQRLIPGRNDIQYLQSYAPGMYFISLRDNNGILVKTQQILKE